MDDSVVFKITGGKLIPEISMPVSSTILDLKKQIKMLNDVEVGRQTLMFNNQELENDQSIGHYEFGDSATLVLDVAPFDATGQMKFYVLVKFGTKETNIKVKETTMVTDLRAKIARYWGIPTQNMTLHCLSTEMENDALSLSAYHVSAGSEIEVKVKTRAR